ncbi:MAG TPA: hypothetical protein EYP30_04055, partial [Archaeoglobaceae archaeon]|nr:hypothetical protein [Archaeoglobaceae archaeon]
QMNIRRESYPKQYIWEKVLLMIVGEAANADEAIELIEKHNPDILFLIDNRKLKVPFRIPPTIWKLNRIWR